MQEGVDSGPARWPWIALFVGATLALLTAAYAYYTHETERIRQEKYEELAAIAELKAGQIRDWRQERLNDARRSAAGPAFKKGLEEWLQDRTNTALGKQLTGRFGFEQESGGYADVILVDLHGTILLSAKPEPQPLDPVEKHTVEEALAKGAAMLSELYRSAQGIVRLSAVAPISDQSGRTVAVVVMRSNADSALFPLIQSWPTPSRTAETLLVRREGDQVLFLNNLRHRHAVALSLRDPLALKDLPAVQAVLGKRGIFEGRDYRGVDVLADLRDIPDSPWFMVAKIDASEILKEARYRGLVAALFSGCFILLAAGVTASGYRRRETRLYRELYRSERGEREAQEQFRITLYSIGDAVITTDTGGLVQQMNPVAERLTGWPEAEATGKSLGEVFLIVNEESREPVEDPALRVLRDGMVVGLANHTLLMARDGTEHPIADSGAPIRDENGAIAGVVLVFRDRTEERKAQKALAQSEKRYRDLWERTPAMMVSLDSDARMAFVSDYFVEALGYTRDELIGRRPFEFQTEWSAEYARSVIFPTFLQTGSVKDAPLQFVKKNGDVIDVLLNVTAERDDRGAVVRSRSIITDITERKKAEAALRTSEARLSDALSLAHLGHWEYDVVNDIFTFNDHFYKIFRTTAEQVGGYTMSAADYARRFVHPDDMSVVADEVRKTIETTDPYFSRNLEHRILYADGEIGYISVRYFGVKDDHGRTIRTYGVNQDITERRSAEEALRQNEERYRTVADFTYDWEYWQDPQGKLLYVSPSCERITGYSAQEFLDDPDLMRRIVHPDDRDELMTHLHDSKAADSETSCSLDFRIIRRDGRTRWVSHACQPVSGKGGQSLGRRACNRDITDRKRSELAQRRLATAVEQAVEAVVIADALGTIEYVNPAFERITGYTREEVLGEKTSLLKSQDDDPLLYQAIQEQLFRGESWEGRLVERRKDGSRYEEDVTISPVRDESGSIINFVAVKRDVSREVQLQKQLVQAQKMEAIGTLAGGVAHDFNNLLQVILGYSELLLAEKSEEESDCEDLKKINQAARSGAELVRSLLTFSRKVEPKPVPLSLNRQIGYVERLLGRTLPKMIDIRLDLAENLATVNADPAQMEHILMNMAVNARDAMPDGGTLTIGTRNELLDEEYCRLHAETEPGSYVLLTVADTGRGMDRETLEHIFEPFFTTKELGRGTGLGLAMVYGIVKQHGGHITCYSEDGRGTVFSVYLPAVSEGPETGTEILEEAPPRGTETILLVDDEDMVSELGERILTKNGYTVFRATDGQEALALYIRHRQQVSLVILDLIMPTMGGIDCLKELLKIDPQVRVLVASGYSGDTSTSECVRLGAKGFVAKPFRFKELLKQVRKTLDES